MDYLIKIFKTENSYSPTVLRVVLGIVMFPHGAQKVLGWFGGYGLEGTLGFLTQQMGLPTLIALLVIAGEFLGPLALIGGFFTRFSAASIGVIMAGAVATVHLGNGFFMNWSGKQAGEGFEYHILIIGIAIALSISGGGKYSLDQWVSENFLKKFQ